MREMTMEDVVRELDELIAKHKKTAEEQGDTLLGAIASRLAKEYESLADTIAQVHRQDMVRWQGARDYVDATLYSLLSTCDIKLTDEFKAAMFPVCRNGIEQKTPVAEMPFTADECKRVADQLEDLRLKMKSQPWRTGQEKCAQIMRDDKLSNARALLSRVAKWIEGKSKA